MRISGLVKFESKQTYPNDPSFLLEFHIVLMKKTQDYFDKLNKT